MSTHIKFNSEKQTVTIEDESKLMHYVFLVFSAIQMFSNGLQIYSRWGQFDSKLFYLYFALFLIFLGFVLFFCFYNSFKAVLQIEDIQHYTEKPFFWTKLRYFKLKDRKIRLINFKSKSEALKDFNDFLNQYQIQIKS